MPLIANRKNKFYNVYEPKSIFIIIYASLIFKQILFDITLFNQFPKKSLITDTLLFLSVYYIAKFIIKQKSLWAIYILLVITSIYMFANSIFYNCYASFLNIAAFLEINQLSKVKSSAGFYFNRIYIFYLIDLILLLILLLRVNKDKEYKEESLKYKVFRMGILIILTICSLIYANYKSPGLIKQKYSKATLYSAFGFISASAIDNYNYIRNNVCVGKLDNEKNKIINENFKASNSELLNYKGKNLIMIQVESLQQFVINRKYQGKEITPNLNKLVSDSLYYDNCYYQISIGHTSDAELLTNNAIYPLKDSAAYITKYNNEYNALPKILNSIGYNSFVIHGNNASFWNRNAIYNKYGFKQFYSLEKLKNDEIVDMGLSDKSLFEQSYDIIEKSKQPFYSFIITLTSHSPFKVDNNFCSANTSLTSYYNAINYTDKQIGMFIDKLKASGILDNSILVIYGDHNAMTIGDKNIVSDEVGKDLNKNYIWQQYQKIPLIIKLPQSGDIGMKSNSVGQVDVMPTILDLYGITGVKHFGTSVLDNNNHKVILRNGSYVYGDNFYDEEYNTTYNINTGKILNNNVKEINDADEQLKASDYIINYNYFNEKNNIKK